MYIMGVGQVSSVQSVSHVQLFVAPWTTARQASLSITNSQGLLKLMSIESVMPSNHLILCWNVKPMQKERVATMCVPLHFLHLIFSC